MQKLIFHIGHSAGFYSEFNNMVIAILYCRRHGIDFSIYSADANFRIKKGWQDYFLPFCNESHNPVHHYINHRFDEPKGGKRKLLYDSYKRIFPNNFLTSELWNDFRHIDYSELTTSEVQKLSAPIINDIYRFNPSTQRQIENLISTIDLSDQYIGFHIRGGDKTSEHDIISIDQYIYHEQNPYLTYIRGLYTRTIIASIFLCVKNIPIGIFGPSPPNKTVDIIIINFYDLALNRNQRN